MARAKNDSGLEPAHDDLESTASLLEKVRRGEGDARDRLIRRYWPRFHGWAHGRLPRSARDLADTDDLVQECFVKAMTALHRFEPRHEGAFLAYLRRILKNRICDEIRRNSIRLKREPIPDDLPDVDPTPLEELIGRETLEAYESALMQLNEMQREAVLLSIELGFTHQEVAEAIGCPTANAARMVVSRALVRMAEIMRDTTERT
jgi:RNA polymerase sigma-70 factor (ECF subfamily)